MGATGFELGHAAADLVAPGALDRFLRGLTRDGLHRLHAQGYAIRRGRTAIGFAPTIKVDVLLGGELIEWLLD